MKVRTIIAIIVVIVAVVCGILLINRNANTANANTDPTATPIVAVTEAPTAEITEVPAQ